MEIRSITEIYNFRRASVVGVPIAEVANTLVQWIRWMAGSYVGHLDTKTASLRSACLKCLGLAISRYDHRPVSWTLRKRDLPRSVCFCKLYQPALDTQNFTSERRPPSRVPSISGAWALLT
jgi:hypothetical protein